MTFPRGILIVCAALTQTFFFTGCGQETAKSRRSSTTVELSVTQQRFASVQQLGKQYPLELTIRNIGQTTADNLAVTLSGITYKAKNTEFANDERPIWILDEGPYGGTTASPTTWTLGMLPPGKARTFRWKFTAVKPGDWQLQYRASPDLQSGSNARGAFQTKIREQPANGRAG